MQATTPRSAAVAAAPTTPPIENDACLSRTTKIALAIFVSLAAFVFLPFGAAIILSAVVTLGAIISSCGSEALEPTPSTSKPAEETKGAPSSSPVRPTPAARPLDPSLLPTEICIHKGEDGSIYSSKKVAIEFLTPTAKMYFVTHHRDKFAKFAWIITLSDYPTIVRIEIKLDTNNQDVLSDRILETLRDIFGDEIGDRITTNKI
jgi:hypothetical protein